MKTLGDLASLIRSKNAGPFQLTIDIMFDDAETYERVRRSGAVNRDVIARLYGLSDNELMFFYADAALAIKATIPRPVFQGDVGDPDGHAGQQYAPVMAIPIPDA